MSKKRSHAKKSGRTVTHIRPKSQTQVANEKRVAAESKKLERAGDAVLAGNKKKADKILASKPKALTGTQAVERMSELQSLEKQLEALDHKIDGVKETYKALKSQRDGLFLKLREEIRDANQGRLEFGGPHTPTTRAKPADVKAGETKPPAPGSAAAASDTKPAGGETNAANGETAPADIDADIASDAKADLDAAAKLGQPSSNGAHAPARRGRKPAAEPAAA